MFVTSAGETGLVIQDKEGAHYNIAWTEAKKFTVHEPKLIPVADGDRIRITANGRDMDGKHLFNGSVFQVEGFDKDGNIRLSNGSTLPSEFGHFQHGYVSTSHSSQGKTADKVIISQSSATFRASSMEQFYVSVSRGKEAVSIYTDDKVHLRQSIGRSAQRTSATELMAQRQAQGQEITRISLFRRWQEQAMETYDHLKSRYRNDGFSPAARTEQEQTR